MTTLLDRYAEPGAGHCRPSWIDRRAGAALSIVITGAGAVLAALATGLGPIAILFAVAGVLFWLFCLRLGLWRMFLGLGIIIVCWLTWVIAVMISVTLLNLLRGQGVEEALEGLNRLLESPTPAGIMFRLATFAGIWPGTWAALRLLHKQSFGTIFSPFGRIHWGEFVGGLALAAAFGLLTLAVNTALVGLPTRTELPIDSWLTILLPLVVLVFFQASGEEIVFRGYLLQQLAARYRSPVIWGFLPAFLFGLAHFSNGEALGLGWHYVAVTTFVGVVTAALVWRTGSLATAMGLHTGVNIFSLLGVGLQGIIEGTQLYLYDESGAETLFVIDGAASLLLLLFVLSPAFPLRGPVATA